MRFPSIASFLCEILASDGYQARIVGGYVRDILKNFTPHEIDMATDAKPEIVLDICQKNNIKCIPTGLKHGTVTTIIHGNQIEITTLRRDVNCDGRHAMIAFTNSFEEDARRRDFTINAMYLDRDLKLYDFFNGQNDLKENIVQFIGDPEQRIHEDYLRIMRYFRFLGYFDDLNLHQDSFDAAVMLAHNLSKISPERIRSELLKILSSRGRHTAVQLILTSKVFEKIGLNFHNIDVSKLYLGDNPIVNLGALMKLSNVADIEILKKLKFTNAEQKLINELLKYDLKDHFKTVFEKMVTGIDTTSDIHRVMQETDKEIYLKLFEMYFNIEMKSLINCNYGEVLEKFRSVINCIKIKEFPLTARDIMNLNYSKQDIGIKLRLARQFWIEHNCMIEKKLLIKLIQN